MNRTTIIITALMAWLAMLLPLSSTAQQLTRYEYWFDNDVNVRQSGSLGGSTQAINLEIDASQLDVGVHWLHFRVLQSNGMYSPVTRSAFYKMPNGEVSMLEYWLDGDRSSVTRLPLREGYTPGTLIYNDSLNLGNVSPGMHRLYYRGVNNNITGGTAVCMAPVMVKSLYQPEVMDAEVVKYSMTVDNEPVVVTNVSHPGQEVAINETLDLRDLPEGQHRLNVQVWNSAYASVSEQATFTVSKPETPTVALTAQQSGGLVTLRFNSIPNDVSWHLIRVDTTGATATVRRVKQGCYPEAVTVVDNPPNGQYTYKARVYYTNNEGAQVPVNSNAVSLTMTTADQVRYGTISGILKAQEGISLSHDWVVRYSDGVEAKPDAFGTFVRDRIPVGTVLEVTAADLNEAGYVFNTQTVVVGEGRNDVTLIGTIDVSQVQNSWAHILEFASHVEFTPGQYMKFKVKNISSHNWWRGRIRLASVKKAYLESSLDPSSPSGDGQSHVGAGSTVAMPSFSAYSDYDDDYSEEFSLAPGKTSDEIYIKHNLNSMRGDDDELYYFFVYSVDHENNQMLVGVNRDYNITENPMLQLVEKNLMAASEQQVMEEDIEYAVNFIIAMLKNVKELDRCMGKLESGYKFVQDITGDQFTYHAMQCNSLDELMAMYPKESFLNILYEEDTEFLDIVHSWRDSIATLVRASGDALKVIKEAQKALKAIKLGASILNEKNDLEIAGLVAEKILDLSESSFPFARILRTYLDITRNSVHNILYLTDRYDQLYKYNLFIEDTFKFKINVKKKSAWQGWYFAHDNVSRQINFVTIDCVAETNTAAHIESTATYKAYGKWWSDCHLERSGFDGQTNDAIGINGIRDMRMKIYWKNGRVTNVPIYNGGEMRGEGVKYDSLDKTFTITLQSDTNDKNRLADIIHLDDD